jgi:hypothetical protein
MSYPIIPAGEENSPDFYIPPYDKDVELAPNYFCRARNTKREKYCRARAGQGTTHLGLGRCKNHGGSVPIIHGRYSDVALGTMAEHIEQLELEEEKEKLDVIPEATLLRALTRNAMERFDEFVAAIMAWNAEEDIEAKATKTRPRFIAVPDINHLADLAKKTAEIVNMVHKQRSANAIALSDFYRLMGAMADSVSTQLDKYLARYVNAGAIEQDTIDRMTAAIQEDWRTIKLKA